MTEGGRNFGVWFKGVVSTAPLPLELCQAEGPWLKNLKEAATCMADLGKVRRNQRRQTPLWHAPSHLLLQSGFISYFPLSPRNVFKLWNPQSMSPRIILELLWPNDFPKASCLKPSLSAWTLGETSHSESRRPLSFGLLPPQASILLCFHSHHSQQLRLATGNFAGLHNGAFLSTFTF